MDLVEVRNLVPDSTDKPLVVPRNRRSIREDVRLEHLFVLNLSWQFKYSQFFALLLSYTNSKPRNHFLLIEIVVFDKSPQRRLSVMLSTEWMEMFSKIFKLTRLFTRCPPPTPTHPTPNRPDLTHTPTPELLGLHIWSHQTTWPPAHPPESFLLMQNFAETLLYNERLTSRFINVSHPIVTTVWRLLIEAIKRKCYLHGKSM